MIDIIDDAPTRTELAILLADIDHDKSNFLVAAFNTAAAKVQAHNGEAMWAIAMLQARVLAMADMGEAQTWAANRFFEMVRVALPGMILAVEQARRSADGSRSHDA